LFQNRKNVFFALGVSLIDELEKINNKEQRKGGDAEDYNKKSKRIEEMKMTRHITNNIRYG
jgi:hypothetical protein